LFPSQAQPLGARPSPCQPRGAAPAERCPLGSRPAAVAVPEQPLPGDGSARTETQRGAVRCGAVRWGAAGAAGAKEALRFSCSSSFPGDAAGKSLLLSPVKDAFSLLRRVFFLFFRGKQNLLLRGQQWLEAGGASPSASEQRNGGERVQPCP